MCCGGKTDLDILEISNAYYETGYCYFAYPNFISTLEGCGEPDDEYFSYQWHLHNTGQYDGTPDADIDMPEAWDMMPTEHDLIIALIDFGFDMEHEDLEPGWAFRPYDPAGYSLDWPPDSNPVNSCPYATQVYCWHGTAVLGMFAPIINNSLGLAGIEESIKITPIKIITDDFKVNEEIIADAFQWANASGPFNADVYSCSWKFRDVLSRHQLEKDLKNLYAWGKPVFWSAGKSGNLNWPATMHEVFAVGATDRWDQPAYTYTLYGDSLDVVAPGHQVCSFDLSGDAGYSPNIDNTMGDPDYMIGFQGTSFSTPIVAALATKILATKPDMIPKNSDAEPIYEFMRNTAHDLGPSGYDMDYGWGRVSAYRALIAISRGDANNDHTVNLSDAVYIINYVFANGPEPIPYFYIGDANCDGAVNVSDAVKIMNYWNGTGDPPPICYLNLPE